MGSRWASAAAAVIAAGVVTLGLAAPANGTDQITANALGTYEATYEWGPKTWVVTPCEGDAFQCVHVTEYNVDDTERKSPQWSANAYWQVGWWIVRDALTAQALTCEDGSQHDLPMTYTWDAATGEGLRSYHEPGICGDAYNGYNRFEAKKLGPAPVPL
ncbi:hypothetical protein AU193_15565 [Mycobacterium sp. GA-1285]|uniref:hypothetical protein n=1 Tax=Mycobacterium sp. GA-1285 TaxID=1772282 RepID=UPI00074A4577|nr:hypothetical protein [Mycobacterium sp. GA-1285]KUI11791.1 hypothetical protein AU193_15565 [Mycobacterium sp. GA-1285]